MKVPTVKLNADDAHVRSLGLAPKLADISLRGTIDKQRPLCVKSWAAHITIRKTISCRRDLGGVKVGDSDL